MEREVEELLRQEEEWSVSDMGEDEWEQMRYWEQGLGIYERLIALRPKDESVRFNLMRCLLELGRGLKGSRTNLRRARELFEQVVQEEKEHSLACYRLGFLYYYESKWSRSASYFERALQRSARYPQHRITDEQIVRAYCYQARAYMNLSRESMERGEERWQELPEAVRKGLRQIVRDTQDQVLNDETYRPYVCSDRSGQAFLSKNELEELLTSGRAVLNFMDDSRWVLLVLPGGETVRLTERPAEYLRILMEHARSFNEEELYERKFGRVMLRRSSVVRENIRRVRRELERYAAKDGRAFLLPEGEGYGWNHRDWPNPAVVYRDTDRYRNEID
ncbi:hypothetical protein MO973_25110 [Paenibacillus sp. TRM 82003]|nr:hypothetical protein [Paenibacillus sp. TRM 82003]